MGWYLGWGGRPYEHCQSIESVGQRIGPRRAGAAPDGARGHASDHAPAHTVACLASSAPIRLDSSTFVWNGSRCIRDQQTTPHADAPDASAVWPHPRVWIGSRCNLTRLTSTWMQPLALQALWAELVPCTRVAVAALPFWCLSLAALY